MKDLVVNMGNKVFSFSMTGFGAASAEDESFRYLVEIKSVNHRFLDLTIKGSALKVLQENQIRTLAAANLKRGKVDIFININPQPNAEKKIDLVLLSKNVAHYRKILSDYNVKNEIIDGYAVLQLILKSDVSAVNIAFKNELTSEQYENLFGCFKYALNDFLEMRKNEGQKLRDALILFINQLIEINHKIKQLSQQNTDFFREKLLQKINEISVNKLSLSEDRILQEVAIIAQKSDVSEEVERIESHISQFKEALNSSPSGKKFDFLTQELGREANTILSKCESREVSSLAVEAKLVIESIREQVQNLE